MSCTRMVACARETPADLRTAPGQSRGLPEDLLRQVSRRRQIISPIGAPFSTRVSRSLSSRVMAMEVSSIVAAGVPRGAPAGCSALVVAPEGARIHAPAVAFEDVAPVVGAQPGDVLDHRLEVVVVAP